MRSLVAGLGFLAAALVVPFANAQSADPQSLGGLGSGRPVVRGVRVANAQASYFRLTPTQAMALDILRWTNVERLARGLSPFEWNGTLYRAALGHSDEMMRLGYFSHTSPTPGLRDPMQRAQRAGLRGRSLYVGENIAWGDFTSADAREMVQMWMNSPGHRRNILDPAFRQLGVGVTQRGSKIWATQLFSARP